MVSKKRQRLGQKRMEDLLLIKENRELVEEYKENCGQVFDLNDDAFKEVVIEADTDVLVIPPNSAVFEEFSLFWFKVVICCHMTCLESTKPNIVFFSQFLYSFCVSTRIFT